MTKHSPAEATEELKPLSKKHQLFVDYYLQCFNATQAYLRVYPSSSTDAARANAARLIATDNVSVEIQARLAEVHMSAEEALKLQADIARADMGEFYDDNLVLDFREAKRLGLTKLVRKIKQKTTTFIAKKESEEDREVHEIELELYPADTAQERILKIHGKLKGDAPVINVIKGYTILANPEMWEKDE